MYKFIISMAVVLIFSTMAKAAPREGFTISGEMQIPGAEIFVEANYRARLSIYPTCTHTMSGKPPGFSIPGNPWGFLDAPVPNSKTQSFLAEIKNGRYQINVLGNLADNCSSALTGVKIYLRKGTDVMIVYLDRIGNTPDYGKNSRGDYPVTARLFGTRQAESCRLDVKGNLAFCERVPQSSEAPAEGSNGRLNAKGDIYNISYSARSSFELDFLLAN